MGKTLIKGLLISTLLLTMLPGAVVLAQDPANEVDQAQTGEEPVNQEPVSRDLSFLDLGYDPETIAGNDRRRSLDYFLYLPANFSINEGSYLQLMIGHAPPIPDKLTTLGVEFNQIPQAVITLDESNAEPTPYQFELSDVLAPGRNNLELNLDAGDICDDKGARVDTIIYNDSYFHLEYNQVQYEPDLALYPLPFFENTFQSNTLYFVFPDEFSTVDLSAAATLTAGLSKFSGGNIDVAAISASELTDEIRTQHHLVIIGRPDTNELLAELDLPVSIDASTFSETQGIVQEMVSPWNPYKMVLVVSGLSDAGVLKASQALNRQINFLGMRGPIAIVQEVLPPPENAGGAQDLDLTLSALGYEDEVIHGLLPQSMRFNFQVPLAWSLLDEPEFVLSFSHAELIDPELSSLNILFNDTPLQGVLLNEENAHDGVLEAPLPAWKIKPGRNELVVSVEMKLRGQAQLDACQLLNSPQAWTTLFSNSYLHLPVSPEQVEPDLALFPYPFTQRPNLDELIVVLPDQPQTSDLTAMLRLAKLLGNITRGEYLSMEVRTALELDSIIQNEDKHIIALGHYNNSTLVGELNESLPQPFDNDGKTLRPGLDSVILVQDPNRTAGVIELLPLPWNRDRTGLILSGTNDEGVTLAYETLFSRRGQLSGNLAVTESLTGTIHTSIIRQSTDEAAAFGPEPVKIEPSLAGRDRERMADLGERWW